MQLNNKYVKLCIIEVIVPYYVTFDENNVIETIIILYSEVIWQILKQIRVYIHTNILKLYMYVLY